MADKAKRLKDSKACFWQASVLKVAALTKTLGPNFHLFFCALTVPRGMRVHQYYHTARLLSSPPGLLTFGVESLLELEKHVCEVPHVVDQLHDVVGVGRCRVYAVGARADGAQRAAFGRAAPGA